jgi:hypothetical protein
MTSPPMQIIPPHPVFIGGQDTRALNEAFERVATDRPAVTEQLASMQNALSIWLSRQPPMTSTALRELPHVSRATQANASDASMRASRVALGLAQVAQWHTHVRRGDASRALASIARQLVDCIHRGVMPYGAGDLIANLPKCDEGDASFPWRSDELKEICNIVSAIDHPVNLGIDESALGVKSLAGIAIARLWMEPMLQRTEGPHKLWDTPPALAMPTEPGTLLHQLTASSLRSCIAKLATCNSVTDLKTCLQTALADFRQMPDGKLAYVDRLRDALAMVEAEEGKVAAVGEALMHPPRPAGPWASMSVTNAEVLAA